MNEIFGVRADFVEFIKDEVNELQNEYPHPNLHDAFTQWAGQLILPDLDSDEIFNLIVNISNSQNCDVDFAYRDDKNGIYYFFQTEYANDPTRTGPEPVRDLFNAYEALSNNEVNQVDEQFALISKELKESISRDFEIRFGIIVFGDLTEQAILELMNRTTKVKNSTWIIYNLEELYNLHFSASGVKYETNDIRLELPIFSDDGMLLELDDLQPYAIVVNVDLLAYARSVAPYIPRIFDANVRHPLKNDVNRGIARTLSDPDERKYFWHYNNGLTILVQDVRKVGNRLIVLGPTIVNGCQTTDTLSKTIQDLGIKANDIKLPLLVRFIKLQDTATNSNLRVSIAKYTNAQAPVLTPDFKSNRDEQEQIAHLFYMLTPPVFYERKRGQWNSLQRAEKAHFTDHVSMVEIAQRWYAFRVSPSYAITQKNNLFSEDGTYKEIFTPPRSAAEYYSAHLLFEQFNKYLIEKKNFSEGKTDDESLFFLELSRAKNLVIAHLIHLVGELVSQKYKQFNNDTSLRVLTKVRTGSITNDLEPLLIGVLMMFNNSLSDDQVLGKEWRNPDTINKLKKFLSQQVAVFNKARINVLDFV
jgi:hypothetical protein